MQGLSQYERFAHKDFFEDKELTVASVSKWLDFTTKEPLGWKTTCAITRDDTPYRPKANGDIISNLYQMVTFKSTQKPDVKPGDVVVPDGDITCTIYGKFRENLSIKCTNLKVVNQKGKA